VTGATRSSVDHRSRFLRFFKVGDTNRVLAIPDLEHAKTAVLNSLTSASGQRTQPHAERLVWAVAVVLVDKAPKRACWMVF